MPPTRLAITGSPDAIASIYRHPERLVPHRREDEYVRGGHPFGELGVRQPRMKLDPVEELGRDALAALLQVALAPQPFKSPHALAAIEIEPELAWHQPFAADYRKPQLGPGRRQTGKHP